MIEGYVRTETQGALRGWAEKDPGAAMPLHYPASTSHDRVQMNASGQVELKLKTPWRDGTTHQVMSPVWTTLLSRRILFLVGCLGAIHKIPGIDLHVGFARCRVI